MSTFARVDSVDALKHWRAALCIFAEKAGAALDEADSDIRRTVMWLRHDQYVHWKNQLRERREEFSLAKQTLKRRRSLDKATTGGKRSYVDEKRAFDVAKERLEQAERKVKSIRRWVQQLEKEAFDYKQLVGGLVDVVELQIPNACAELDRMIVAVQAYAGGGPRPAGAKRADHVAPTTPLSEKTLQPSVTREDCQALRKQTPPPALRDRVSVGLATCTCLSKISISLAERRAIARVVAERAPVAPDDKVVLGVAEGTVGRIYFERLAGCEPGDSGWFAGSTADDAVSYDGVRAADVLDVCGDLADVLTLPVGYLVMFNGPSLEAVVDGDDHVVWAAARKQDGDDADAAG